MAFLKTGSGITFGVDSFSLRHPGKTHRDSGLLTDLQIPLFLVKKTLFVGCGRHHGSKVKWVTGQLCISSLSAGKAGAKMCIKELDHCVG